MKYKAGDKVRVRSDLVANGDYGGWRFEAEMIDKKGIILTVDSIDSDDYYIMDDKSEYWTDEMLEDVEEEFKLPDKWHIIVQSDEEAVVYKRFFEANNGGYGWFYNIGYFYGFSNGEYVSRDAGTRITFDQFKKYVLKESESTPVKENKIVWLNGRWYRILNNWWGKFETIHNSGKRIKFSESITASGKYDATPKNIDLISEIELLTDLSEIQQYLPENHPDKIKKRTKKVEDLRYPDVVHCNSQKERNLLKNHVPEFDINNWTSEDPYLLVGGGCCSHPYGENTLSNYVNYEFSDIIFPEEEVVDKWFTGSYVVSLKKNAISITGFNEGSIASVIGNNSIRVLSKPDESWACNQRDEEIGSVKWFPTLKEAQAFSDELLGRNKVGTKPKLSKEELLAEAKRRYPVGTKYKTASNDSSDIFVLSSNNWGDSLLDDVVHAEHGKGCLYYKGDWAEIISKPIVEENPKYVECIGLEETDVLFWSHAFTVGEIYLVEKDDETTSFRINGAWCDKSQFKPSTKEAFDKQSKSVVEKKEELVQTEMSQRQACDSCKYIGNCGTKGFSCKATGGQHYPKDNSSERYIVTADLFDSESSSGGIEVGKFPLNRGMGFYEQMAKMHMQAYYPMGPIRGLYKSPIESKDCFESDEIYVPIIKTEVKQIKL